MTNDYKSCYFVIAVAFVLILILLNLIIPTVFTVLDNPNS